MKKTFFWLLALFILLSLYGWQAKSSAPVGSAPDLRQAKQLQPQDIYPLHNGFPINIDTWIEKAPPVVADINHDGSNELLVQTLNGKVFAWNQSGSLVSGFPINSGGNLSGRLALGDLNHDGKLEIVAGEEPSSKGVSARVFVWQSDGSPLPGWPRSTACYRAENSCRITSVVLADIDKDSTLEVIASTTNNNIDNADPNLVIPNLYVWRGNGQLAAGNWPSEDPFNCGIFGAVAIGDLNGDSWLDIATGRDYNRLFVYDRLGNFFPGWPVKVYFTEPGTSSDSQIEFGRSAVSLADLDLNGTLEYIVPGLESHGQEDFYRSDLLVYETNGTRRVGWETPAAGGSLLSSTLTHRMLQAPAIGDLNGDQYPDIVVSTQDGWIRAYTGGKQLLWGFNYAQGKLLNASEAVIGDIDGDGWNEVLFGIFDPNYGNIGPVGVWILDHNGDVKPGSPLLVDAPGVTSAPVLADVDGNGKVEIIADSSYGKIYVWDAPGASFPDRFPWPMARHDLQRSGLFQYVQPELTQSAMTVSANAPKVGDTVTFTIKLINKGAHLADTVHLTDIVPAGLSYIPNSLVASAGVADQSHQPELRWTGNLPDWTEILITFRVMVTSISSIPIINQATIDAGSGGQFIRSATLIVNGKELFLPYIRR